MLGQDTGGSFHRMSSEQQQEEELEDQLLREAHVLSDLIV